MIKYAVALQLLGFLDVTDYLIPFQSWLHSRIQNGNPAGAWSPWLTTFGGIVTQACMPVYCALSSVVVHTLDNPGILLKCLAVVGMGRLALH